MAEIYKELNNSSKSIFWINKAIDIDNKLPMLYLFRSIYKSSLGMSYDDVIGDIDTAIALNNKNPSLFLAKAVYLNKFNRIQDKNIICENFNKALELGLTEMTKYKDLYCK